MVNVPRESRAEDLIRVASLGATFISVAEPLVILILFGTFPSLSHHFLEALGATAVYLPLYLHHVRTGLRGRRPAHLPFTLGVMAIVIIGVTPLLGPYWFYSYSALFASVLVTMPPRFSIPMAACILVCVGIWAGELSNGYGIPLYGGGQAVYFSIAVADRAAAVFILVWLVTALRRVQSGQSALAEAALTAERDRIDIELRESVGAELKEVVVKGVRAEDALRRGLPEVQEELTSLVEGSRRALANARQILRRYKVMSPEVELENAASFLRAAGIAATVECREIDLPPALDETLRSSLRVEVAQLICEDASGPVVLTLRRVAGEFELVTTRPSSEVTR
jgi:two-component system, NarL family, sensor histidine kinase DesK